MSLQKLISFKNYRNIMNQ